MPGLSPPARHRPRRAPPGRPLRAAWQRARPADTVATGCGRKPTLPQPLRTSDPRPLPRWRLRWRWPGACGPRTPGQRHRSCPPAKAGTRVPMPAALPPRRGRRGPNLGWTPSDHRPRTRLTVATAVNSSIAARAMPSATAPIPRESMANAGNPSGGGPASENECEAATNTPSASMSWLPVPRRPAVSQVPSWICTCAAGRIIIRTPGFSPVTRQPPTSQVAYRQPLANGHRPVTRKPPSTGVAVPIDAATPAMSSYAWTRARSSSDNRPR